MGTCEEMCPETERTFRIRHRLVHPLETPKDGTTTAPESLMVKRYSRSAAGSSQSMSEVRTPSCLSLTVDYLLTLVARNPSSHDWSLVYEFVCDRLRAIRQDLVVGRVPADTSLMLLSRLIAFYVTSEYRCERFPCAAYNRVLHRTQLDECINRWCECQQQCDSFDEEIAGVILLLREDAMVAQDALQWRARFPSPSLATRVRELIQAARTNNFRRYFRLMRALPHSSLRIAACRRVPTMRQRALACLAVAYRSRGVVVPLEYLAEMLAFDSVREMRECLGDTVEISEDGVCFFGHSNDPPGNLTSSSWMIADRLIGETGSSLFTQ